MKFVPFSAAKIASGKNKGQSVAPLHFATGIKAENNTTGLPVESGKVMLPITGADLEVMEFESADEVRQAAGDQFDVFVVEAANARAKSAARAAITNEGRKVTLAPQNPLDWAKALLATLSPEGLFTPKVRVTSDKAPRGVKAEIAKLTSITADMLADPEYAAQFLAKIQALAAGK
jgi:hypothetical protein